MNARFIGSFDTGYTGGLCEVVHLYDICSAVFLAGLLGIIWKILEVYMKNVEPKSPVVQHSYLQYNSHYARHA